MTNVGGMPGNINSNKIQILGGGTVEAGESVTNSRSYGGFQTRPDHELLRIIK